jgi:hypothetical protein
MIVEVDGVRMDVPDDATPDEIDSLSKVAGSKSAVFKAGASVLTPEPKPKATLGDNINSFFGRGDPAHPEALTDKTALLNIAKGGAKALALLGGRGKPLPADAGRAQTFLMAPNTGVVPLATSGALAGFGFSNKEDLPGLAADTAVGAVAGPVIGKTVQAALKAPRSISESLASGAESAAVRSTNADRTAVRRAFKGNEDARHSLGRFMLDENIPLRSPQLLRESAQAIQSSAGPEIGAITKAADEGGTLVDLRSAVEAAKADRSIAGLSKNTVTRAKHEEIVGMLEDQIAQHGEKVPPSVAHDIRMQLDQQANWDQAAPKALVKAWRTARGAVDTELDRSMTASGLADKWTEANSRFSSARKLTNPETQRGLADIGAERRAANRYLSPSEKAAGVFGGGLAAIGNPTALAIPAATWTLNRYGFPVAARTMDATSRGFGRMADALERVPSMPSGATVPGSAVAARELSPGFQAFLDALRARLGGPRLSPAYGDQETPK